MLTARGDIREWLQTRNTVRQHAHDAIDLPRIARLQPVDKSVSAQEIASSLGRATHMALALVSSMSAARILTSVRRSSLT
jgi:hypothetical protein